MQILYDLSGTDLTQETVLTIGAFDGLHLGHQELLRRLVRRARHTGRLSGVVTFDPLPRAVLSASNNIICLSTTEEKAHLLESLGLDVLVVLPFTPQLAATSAHDFMQMLYRHLRMSELWIGWDFALGRGREGDATALRRLGRSMGFQVHVIAPVAVRPASDRSSRIRRDGAEGETVISSTQIRKLLSEGMVREATEMLGRYHRLQGDVVRGTGQDSELGFPTANLQLPLHCAIPASGVYATYVTVGTQRHPAVANINVPPSPGAERRIGLHLLGFSGDLIGRQITVQFVERLRPQRRFATAEALRAQIGDDVSSAREILE